MEFCTIACPTTFYPQEMASIACLGNYFFKFCLLCASQAWKSLRLLLTWRFSCVGCMQRAIFKGIISNAGKTSSKSLIAILARTKYALTKHALCPFWKLYVRSPEDLKTCNLSCNFINFNCNYSFVKSNYWKLYVAFRVWFRNLSNYSRCLPLKNKRNQLLDSRWLLEENTSRWKGQFTRCDV